MATIDEELALIRKSLNPGGVSPTVYILRMDSTETFNPKAPEFKQLLLEHYKYGLSLKESGKLLIAGPSGDEFGLFIIKASSKEEAEEIAAKEPFGVAGIRKNSVAPWTITTGILIDSVCEAVTATDKI